jgi:hypothetical protein
VERIARRARPVPPPEYLVHPPWRILTLGLREFWVIWDGSDRSETPVDACARARAEGLGVE